MNEVVCRENYGSTSVRKSYVKTADEDIKVVQLTERLASVSQAFRSVFLPQGYPSSVSEDYLVYQIWDTVQAFCSSITGALATQAVLKGVGVGDDSATVMAATITWLMKDGTGMVGRIGFAWMQGSYLDSDCKRWRLFADILNDVAILIDICAPVFQSYFTVIVCMSGLCRSIVGVAGGATRAALTQHQARRNNMADVSAKDGSQETLVNLSALVCSLILIPLVSGHDWCVWTLFFIFTALHIFANYSAVTSVCMETFNSARLHIVVQDYLLKDCQQVLKVKDANAKEPVLRKTRRRFELKIGVSMTCIINSYDDLCQLAAIYSGTNYLLKCDLRKGVIYIVLHKEASAADMLEAAFQAEIIEYALHQASKPVIQTSLSKHIILLHKVVEAANHGDELSLLKLSWDFSQKLFSSFTEQCKLSGWVTSHAWLCADEWRAVWGQEARSWTDKKLY